MGNNADVIIIGGGVIGCAAAYYLTKKGFSVIVLEKSGVIGDGGSSRNGGGVRQSGRDKRELPLAMYGVANMWPVLSDELETAVEYYRDGNLRLGKTEEHIKILEGLTSKATAAGLNVEMISGSDAREICPYLSEEVIGASFCPTDGHANPLLTTLAYYRKARRRGARFITGEEITRIRKCRGQVGGVDTASGNVYESDTVILAAGYESRHIAATAGIEIPMNRALLEVLVTEAHPPMFYQMLGTAAADFYGHQTKHGSFVFGGSSGFEGLGREREAQNSTSLTAPCICRGIMKYFPCLSETKIIRTWAGWMDDCADHVPVISKTDEVPGLILACGFSGHGFGISPVVGLALSQLAAGEEPIMNLSDFRYDRFHAKI